MTSLFTIHFMMSTRLVTFACTFVFSLKMTCQAVLSVVTARPPLILLDNCGTMKFAVGTPHSRVTKTAIVSSISYRLN